jgi:hypothetical protein
VRRQQGTSGVEIIDADVTLSKTNIQDGKRGESRFTHVVIVMRLVARRFRRGLLARCVEAVVIVTVFVRVVMVMVATSRLFGSVMT